MSCSKPRSKRTSGKIQVAGQVSGNFILAARNPLYSSKSSSSLNWRTNSTLQKKQPFIISVDYGYTVVVTYLAPPRYRTTEFFGISQLYEEQSQPILGTCAVFSSAFFSRVEIQSSVSKQNLSLGCYCGLCVTFCNSRVVVAEVLCVFFDFSKFCCLVVHLLLLN